MVRNLTLKDKTAREVVNNLRVVFATHGIPKIVVSDNQPFNSFEFKGFASKWNFVVITTSPRYPRSNGQAERVVQIAKKLFKKCNEDRKDINVA